VVKSLEREKLRAR